MSRKRMTLRLSHLLARLEQALSRPAEPRSTLQDDYQAGLEAVQRTLAAEQEGRPLDDTDRLVLQWFGPSAPQMHEWCRREPLTPDAGSRQRPLVERGAAPHAAASGRENMG